MVKSIHRILRFLTFLVFIYLLFIQYIFIEHLLYARHSFKYLEFTFTEKAVTENKQIGRGTKKMKARWDGEGLGQGTGLHSSQGRLSEKRRGRTT